MEVTTKELRLQPGKIIEQVTLGKEIVVTFRGKPLAKIIPYAQNNTLGNDEEIFGIWKNNTKTKNVESYVRSLRKGREL